MAHVASRATVVVDNPHAAGYVSKLAFQRDWRFEKRKHDDDVYGGVSGQFTIHSGTEYLEAMHCLKPAPYLEAGDMTGKWTTVAGNWRVTSPSVCSPRSTWEDYYSSGPGQYGQIVSTDDYGCNVVLGIIRAALPNDVADYNRYVSIRFNGSTQQDTFRETAFVFPYGMKSRPHPYVLDALTSEAPGGLGDEHLRAYWELSGNHAAKLDKDTRIEFIFFELIDGSMVVRHSDVDKAFVYTPYDWHDRRFRPYGAWSRGTISITVYGHAAMIYCDHLSYPTSSNALAQPYQGFSTDLYSDINDLTKRTLHKHGWTPLGNVGTYFQNDDEIGNWATVATMEGDNHGGYAPRVTFNWGGVGSTPTDCPAVYVMTLDVMATHAAAVSSPDALEGEKIVRSLEYRINNKGRGQTCSIVVDDPTGTKAAAWKGQNLVTASCGWNDVTPVQKFKGYMGERPEIVRSGDEDVGRTRYQMDLQDPVGARLAAKFMIDRSAAGYEQLATFVYRTLYDAGEPAAYLTDILALRTGSMVDVYIPGSYGAKNLAHDFEPTVSVPDALDKVCEALGYAWGWNCETGQWFLRPVKQLYSGTPDWTLDIAAAAAGGEYALEIKHVRSQHEFRNYLYMIARSTGGAESVNLWADQNSHMVSSASNFIGCDLWEVVKETELWSGLAKGQARWEELQRFPSVLSWTMRGKTTLGPNKTVKAQVTYMGVATDAIYRIVEERGDMPGEPSLNWTQTFTAEWVKNA